VTYFALGVACTWPTGWRECLFDAALSRAFDRVSGRFSTRSESIGFMTATRLSWSRAVFTALRVQLHPLVRRHYQTHMKPIRRSPEVKFFLVPPVIIVITAWQVWHAGMYNATDSLVHAFFLGQLDDDR
jgi:trk system potassium uptake protein TrkH